MRRFAAFTGNLALLRVIHRRKSAFRFAHLALCREPSRGLQGRAHQRPRLEQTNDHDDGADNHVIRESARYCRTNGPMMSQPPQSSWNPLT
jgi:hypothetical protein